MGNKILAQGKALIEGCVVGRGEIGKRLPDNAPHARNFDHICHFGLEIVHVGNSRNPALNHFKRR